MMVVIGTDAHKKSHTLVAADPGGAKIATFSMAATPHGHLGALKWAARFPQRRWAIEDCRNLSRRFEADLLTAGEEVARVPPKMMAGTRSSARTRGKSDPIDALAVARAALREPDLPVAFLDGPTRDIKLMVDYRETLVKQRTATENRLRWRLHEIDPEFEVAAGSLDRYTTLERVIETLQGHHSVLAQIARDETDRIRQYTIAANRLERDLATRIKEVVPSLLEIPGCGALTAAKLLGEAADITRFKDRNAYAMWTGTAPIPVWSYNERVRLNRGGNRQSNAALHRISITQIRIHPAAQQFIARRLATGNTKRQAIRAHKRRLCDVVYRAMTTDAQATQTTTHQQAA